MGHAKNEHFLFFAASVSDNEVILSGQEAHHLLHVLSFGIGDRFKATNGKGALWECELSGAGRSEAVGKILSRTIASANNPEVHLFAGLPERDAFELLIEHCCALGITRFIPVECTYSQQPWWRTKWEKSRRRFERKMIAACKQSHNLWLPAVENPVTLAASLALCCGTVAYADQDTDTRLNDYGKLPGDVISCFVGPPGGFSPQEKAALDQCGARKLCLSARRLRTELAATVASALLMLPDGDINASKEGSLPRR
ncbi:MAG: RsmE family RNA methyltransferase [Chitinivibrionales bacterium]|nr:RsmE family RNA methyltransferase [Chitinivibrionales bacterium]